jgi:hypothetical protein
VAVEKTQQKKGGDGLRHVMYDVRFNGEKLGFAD